MTCCAIRNFCDTLPNRSCLSGPRIKRAAHLGVNSQVLIIWGPLCCGQRHRAIGDIRFEVLRALNMESTLCSVVSAGNLVDFSRGRWALGGQQTLKVGQGTGNLSWVVTVLKCIPEVPDSKLGLHPDLRDIFVVLLSSCRQMPEQYRKLCNCVRSTSFLIHYSQPSNYATILPEFFPASSVT